MTTAITSERNPGSPGHWLPGTGFLGSTSATPCSPQVPRWCAWTILHRDPNTISHLLDHPGSS